MTQTTSQVEAMKLARDALLNLIGEHYGDKQTVISNQGRRAAEALCAELTRPLEVAPVGDVEAAAKLIYGTWKDIPEYRPWPESAWGNSLKQDEARRVARQILTASRAPEVVRVEPVAWMRPSKEGYDAAYRDASTVKMSKYTGATHWDDDGWLPLYTAPPSTAPAQSQDDLTGPESGRPTEREILAANAAKGYAMLIGLPEVAALPKDTIPPGGAVGAQWMALPAGATRALHQAREALLGPVADGLSRRAAVDSIDQALATPAAEQGDAKDAQRYRFWRDCWGGEQFLPTLSRTITALSRPLKKGDYNNFDIVSDAAILASKPGGTET